MKAAVDLDAAFVAVLGADNPATDRVLLGAEHEFRVLSNERPIDFRTLIHELPIPGRRVDPDDHNAYRCGWGGKITADGPEAEIAIPPTELRSGFTGALRGRLERGRVSLEAALPEQIELEGYSTHLSVSVRSDIVEDVARVFAATFAPGLMLLMDRPTSPGLLVRPRPGRLELGGDFVSGEQLRAAASFTAGSVLACSKAIEKKRRRGNPLPPRIKANIEPAVERYGWYVDRRAFGLDLYSEGRRARLRRVHRGSITGQAHLERCWEVALGELPSGYDTKPAQDLVFGSDPLPLDTSVRSSVAPNATSAKERIRLDIARPGYSVHVTIATWAFTVYELRSGTATRYACIPAALIDRFTHALSRGELDRFLICYLNGAPSGRMLESKQQTTEPGLFDEVGDPTRLLDPEKAPEGAPGTPTTRLGKQFPPTPTTYGYVNGGKAKWPWWVAAGAFVALAAGGFLLFRPGAEPVSAPGTLATPAAEETLETPEPPPEQSVFVLPGDTLELTFTDGQGDCSNFPESFGAAFDVTQNGKKVQLAQQGTDQKTKGTVTSEGKLETRGETGGHTEIYQLQVDGKKVKGRYSYFDPTCDHHYKTRGRLR